MAEKAANRRVDGFLSVEGGVDSGRSPSIIKPNQVAKMRNATVRGGCLMPRPGYALRKALQKLSGSYQGSATYIADDGRNCILVASGGNLYKVDPFDNWAVSGLNNTATDNNPSSLNRVYWCQAENYMVIQDGQSIPWIFDGRVLRRSAADEIKTGTVMAYANGRIWYATQNNLAFRACDIVRGPSGTAANNYRDAVIKETENDYLNEGGDFGVPSTSGGITAMVVPGVIDTSLGQGPLQVFTQNTVFSVNAPTDRDQWKNLRTPIQTVSQLNYGATGQGSVVPVNGDIFYRSIDGIRSFVVATRNFGQWGNTPISSEVAATLSTDQDDLLPWASGVLWDNRLIMTCQPVWDEAGIYHESLVVLNFDLVGSITERVPPAWEDLWDGLKFLNVFTMTISGRVRCFVLTLSSDDGLDIWELSKEDTKDRWNENSKRIKWSFDTASYRFDSPFNKKRLVTADLFVDELRGCVKFDAAWKPDGHPTFVDWHTWSEQQSPSSICDPSYGCLSMECVSPTYRPKMRLPKPPSTCNDALGSPLYDFYELQMRLEITGFCRLRQLRIHAEEVSEPPFGECRSNVCDESEGYYNPLEDDEDLTQVDVGTRTEYERNWDSTDYYYYGYSSETGYYIGDTIPGDPPMVDPETGGGEPDDPPTNGGGGGGDGTRLSDYFYIETFRTDAYDDEDSNPHSGPIRTTYLYEGMPEAIRLAWEADLEATYQAWLIANGYIDVEHTILWSSEESGVESFWEGGYWYADPSLKVWVTTSGSILQPYISYTVLI